MKDIVNNKIIWIIVGIVSISILTVFGLYILNFHDHEISKNPEEWGQFGDYIGGVLNALVSVLNLILITYLTVKIAKIDEDRSKNNLKDSVKPLGLFSYEVSKNSLKIELHNVGLGPLILKELKIFDDIKEHSDFKEFIEKHTLSYRPNFSVTKSTTEEGTIIRKDDYLSIIDMQIDENSDGIEYAKKLESLNKIKKEIAKCKIKISYFDLYGNLIKEEIEKLNLIDTNCD